MQVYFEIYSLDLLKLIIYAVFFTIIILKFGLPIHMIRELYHTLSNFILKVKDLVQYTRAVQNLKNKYPNATLEELEQTDKVCIICREEMMIPQGPEIDVTLRNTPKKLGCGHIFHFKCLKSWLERQQSCPTCRSSVLTGIFLKFTLVNPTPNVPLAHPQENPNAQGQAGPEVVQDQALNGIPKFSSMNDLLKNLQNIAEKQGISMDKFRIRRADQGPSGTKVSQNETTYQNSSIFESSSSHNSYDGKAVRLKPSIQQKLDHLKHLHQQVGNLIADLENDIYTVDDHLESKIDKGKKKM